MKKYEILGGNLPVVVCELAAGESMITESGSMSWMSPNMKMETVGGGMKKMLGRAFSGENAFQNRYSAQGGDGMIAFASSFPGSVNALEIGPGKTLSGFMRKIDKSVKMFRIGTMEDIDKTVEAIKEL